MLDDQRRAGDREGSPGLDVVANALPGLLARLAGVGRDQPHPPHQPGPLLVVVADARRLPEMVLLKVGHLMH